MPQAHQKMLSQFQQNKNLKFYRSANKTLSCFLHSLISTLRKLCHSAINPLLVEGQIEGGVAQGIGMALMEDYKPGRTENLHDYLIPTVGDMPIFDHILVEVADDEGPYGAKGLGEHVLIPTAPAILNAIRHATEASIHKLPATPDKIFAAVTAVNLSKVGKT